MTEGAAAESELAAAESAAARVHLERTREQAEGAAERAVELAIIRDEITARQAALADTLTIDFGREMAVCRAREVADPDDGW